MFAGEQPEAHHPLQDPQNDRGLTGHGRNMAWHEQLILMLMLMLTYPFLRLPIMVYPGIDAIRWSAQNTDAVECCEHPRLELSAAYLLCGSSSHWDAMRIWASSQAHGPMHCWLQAFVSLCG